MANQRDKKLRVAVVGATGLAGQQFLTALDGHPWFEVTHLAASSRSAGKTYLDAIRDESGRLGWYAGESPPAAVASLKVVEAKALDATSVDLVFSCVEAGPARELEPLYAKHTPVISTASAFRREEDTPVIVPGVNEDHAVLFETQRAARGWKGFITPNPNCTTVGLAITLAPLYRRFGIERVHMVSLQAVSGAGRSPGVIGLDIIDNVLPYIPKEEEKVEWETQKILGKIADGKVSFATFPVSATCTRIGVLEGHTEAVHIQLGKDASEKEIAAAWAEAGEDFPAGKYPSAPEKFIHLHDDPFRPQVRFDRDLGDGMTTTVGRLRRDPNVDRGWKYVLCSHNTKMGAAKGCVLLAERLLLQGVIG